MVLRSPRENLSSIGREQRRRTRRYLVGGITLEVLSHCGAAGLWQTVRVDLLSVEIDDGAAAPNSGDTSRRRSRDPTQGLMGQGRGLVMFG